MRIGELATRAQVSIKAVRYYEQLRLVQPERSSNGYREYSDRDLRVVSEIRALSGSGSVPVVRRPLLRVWRQGTSTVTNAQLHWLPTGTALQSWIGPLHPFLPDASTLSHDCSRARSELLERRSPP